MKLFTRQQWLPVTHSYVQKLNIFEISCIFLMRANLYAKCLSLITIAMLIIKSNSMPLLCALSGGYPSPLNYNFFPKSCCTYASFVNLFPLMSTCSGVYVYIFDVTFLLVLNADQSMRLFVMEFQMLGIHLFLFFIFIFYFVFARFICFPPPFSKGNI